ESCFCARFETLPPVLFHRKSWVTSFQELPSCRGRRPYFDARTGLFVTRSLRGERTRSFSRGLLAEHANPLASAVGPEGRNIDDRRELPAMGHAALRNLVRDQTRGRGDGDKPHVLDGVIEKPEFRSIFHHFRLRGRAVRVHEHSVLREQAGKLLQVGGFEGVELFPLFRTNLRLERTADEVRRGRLRRSGC